ncbi:UDP-3-O-(3-hydroxymyristoyl)glucosamine N-acyltransferase [uncultured Brevundimonas sp.]|uniref:UDP-3-O-(3-hydroxymyristoyl)glucosamine N-acyltransferase n=1 Tax=uncultured Brevundimonas sp. TaxID=213418 RepID=UPI00261323BB|nr:UDP-3-O-(3-hydroxymyristoyl)glucosamine N-acyltransferase [uncultured Brevundimonas sp.]
MPDTTFFTTLPPRTVSAIAAELGAEVIRGGEVIVSAVAPLSGKDGGAIAFMGDRKYLPDLEKTKAACVIVHPSMVDHVPAGVAVIASRQAQADWALTSMMLHEPRRLLRAIPLAEAAEDDTVVIEPGVVIGEGARIGRGSYIGANTVIGPGVQIGRDCTIGSSASLFFCLLGDRVKIYSGVRIGEAGFGAAVSRNGPVDIPQLGRVIIQDNVTIGANSCVDRGAFDDTVIGENTKIDNLVMIGHNCVIGRNNLLAGNTGISGSVTTGDNVIFGGKAGIGDHINIGEGARVAAGAGVLADVPAGETWSGYPARPLRRFLRETVWVSKQASKPRDAKDS